MPKKGQRTFFNLLRVFGIVGEEGRRLSFALGNDISPVVNADDYDPPPGYASWQNDIGPEVGEFTFWSLDVSLTAHIHVHQIWGNTLGGADIEVLVLPSFAALSGFQLSNLLVHASVSGSGKTSNSFVRTGGVLNDPTLTFPSMSLRDSNTQTVLAGGRGLVIGPKRILVLLTEVGESFQWVGATWTEMEPPPASIQ